MSEKLFTEFPPVPTEKWEEVIVKDLKGADYDKKLVWKTLEGISLRPYYRAENLTDLKFVKYAPGQYPFVRGTKLNNTWKVRQDFCTKDPKEANAKALDVLMRGADSVGFRLKKGLMESDYETLLKNIKLTAAEVNFVKTRCTDTGVIEFVAKKVKAEGLDAKEVCGSVDMDPLRHLTLTGAFHESEEKTFELLKKGIEAAKELPRFRTIGVSGYIFNNAGSTIVQELAFALAMGNEYMAKLTDLGLSADEVARRIKFTFAVSSNYFMEIAKFRAGRMLWAAIVNAYKPEKDCSERMKIHAVTSKWNQTVYDAYVNMLRGTTEAMSATIAGVDSLEVLPFDAAFRRSSEFSSRIARNTQILLKEESYFDKVVDPSAGSYYIENLTNSIANEAWKLFKEIEEKGGYTAAFKAGGIQSQIAATAQKRDMNIATRRDILLGTNQYPNFTEKLDAETRESAMGKGGCCCSCNEAPANKVADPIKLYRGAQAFEELRMKTEESGKKPMAFMLTFGNLAMCRARAQFASNFFGCAGIEVVDNNRFETVEEGVKAAVAANASIVVACSSDDDYAEAVPQIHQLLGSKAILVVAGAPASEPDLRAKGITHFISVKSNVLETLKEYQKELGI